MCGDAGQKQQAQQIGAWCWQLLTQLYWLLYYLLNFSCLRVMYFDLAISFFHQIKIGLQYPEQNHQESLISSCLGLSTGMSDNCQLLFIKAHTLAKDRSSGELSPIAPSPPLSFNMPRVHIHHPFSYILFYSGFSPTSSEYVFLLQAVFLSPGYISINWYTFLIPVVRNLPRHTESEFMRMGSGQFYKFMFPT